MLVLTFYLRFISSKWVLSTCAAGRDLPGGASVFRERKTHLRGGGGFSAKIGSNRDETTLLHQLA